MDKVLDSKPPSLVADAVVAAAVEAAVAVAAAAVAAQSRWLLLSDQTNLVLVLSLLETNKML